ncbi:hypothetical protein Vafri_19948 [Volvox africanus]|nr:hypothetical protein Vafri_19948 [Volvox africanus]
MWAPIKTCCMPKPAAQLLPCLTRSTIESTSYAPVAYLPHKRSLTPQCYPSPENPGRVAGEIPSANAAASSWRPCCACALARARWVSSTCASTTSPRCQAFSAELCSARLKEKDSAQGLQREVPSNYVHHKTTTHEHQCF